MYLYSFNFIAIIKYYFVIRYTTAFISIFILLLCSCSGNNEKSQRTGKRPAPKVDGYIVKTEAYSETIEVPGSVVANEVTDIHPEVSGRVVSLNAREGQTVGRGAIIAKIYDGDLQAQLKKYQAQLGIAKANEERAAKLLEMQGISRQDYDATLLNVRNILADMEIVKTDIARTQVRAPFSGKMGLKGISPGAYVTPATVIATINQVSTLKIDFSVPEKYAGRLHNGQIVTFTTEGSDKIFAAKVTASESNISIENRSLMYRAIITGPANGLIPGSFAKVKISFSPNPNTIFIPTQSLVPTAKGKQVIIKIDGRAVFGNVETGVRDSSRIEITKGLKPGDTILVTGIMSTRPGDSLSIGRMVSEAKE